MALLHSTLDEMWNQGFEAEKQFTHVYIRMLEEACFRLPIVRNSDLDANQLLKALKGALP